jgi:hypothetical protein
MGDHASTEESMFHQIAFCAALVTLAMVGSSFAQPVEKRNDVPMPPVIEWPQQITEGTATSNLAVLKRGESLRHSTRPTQELLTEIARWLSINFALTAANDLPRVDLVPAAKIAALRYRGLAGWQMEQGAVPDQPGQREVVSTYDDAKTTIYMREDWTGRTPAELSILVHEMVHHLQNVGKMKFACPQEREQLAYEAQQRWLSLHGGDLLRDFELDPLFVLVATNCIY